MCPLLSSPFSCPVTCGSAREPRLDLPLPRLPLAPLEPCAEAERRGAASASCMAAPRVCLCIDPPAPTLPGGSAVAGRRIPPARRDASAAAACGCGSASAVPGRKLGMFCVPPEERDPRFSRLDIDTALGCPDLASISEAACVVISPAAVGAEKPKVAEPSPLAPPTDGGREASEPGVLGRPLSRTPLVECGRFWLPTSSIDLARRVPGPGSTSGLVCGLPS